MRGRWIVAGALTALVVGMAPAAEAADYPSNWSNCRAGVGDITYCNAIVTLKSTDWGTARNLCRAKIVDQAVALGYKFPSAPGAVVEKRPHKRFWCRVFIQFHGAPPA